MYVFAEVRVELFGSSASGFALVTSNVNLNLNIPEAQEKMVSMAAATCISIHGMLQC